MGKSKVKEKKVSRRSQGVSPTALAEHVQPALPPSPSPETEFEPMTLRSSGAADLVSADEPLPSERKKKGGKKKSRIKRLAAALKAGPTDPRSLALVNVSPIRDTSAPEPKPSKKRKRDDAKGTSASQSSRNESATLNAATSNAIKAASTASRASSATPAPLYMPILQLQTVPPHLRHPFRSFPSTATFDISQAIQSGSSAEKQPSHAYFEYATRTPHAYWADVDTEQQQQEITQRRKLVVLDLNGALLVRSERTTHYVSQAQRKVFPRPFLNCFLDFLMSPISRKEKKPQQKAQPDRMRPFEAFIWSSAQPKSIWDMVSSTFGPWADAISVRYGTRQRALERIAQETSPEKREGKVLGVWSRADMGLTHEEYFQKSATFKDLDKLYTLFTRDNKFSGHSRFSYPDPMFFPDPTNTLLIDDSTAKASLQPYNHLPILDLEWKMLKTAAEAVEEFEQVHGVSKVLKPADALRLIFGHSALDFYRRTLSYGTGIAMAPEEKTVDGILLAIIGILSEIQDVQSIPAWLAAGGLRPDVSDTFTEDIARLGWEHVVALDANRHRPAATQQEGTAGSKRKRRKLDNRMADQDSLQRVNGGVIDETPSLELNGNSALPQMPTQSTNHIVQTVLPSHPDYQHWYDSPLHVLYWVRRGLIALGERGVRLQHNMSGIEKRLQDTERERQELDDAVEARRAASLAGPSSLGQEPRPSMMAADL